MSVKTGCEQKNNFSPLTFTLWVVRCEVWVCSMSVNTGVNNRCEQNMQTRFFVSFNIISGVNQIKALCGVNG